MISNKLDGHMLQIIARCAAHDAQTGTWDWGVEVARDKKLTETNKGRWSPSCHGVVICTFSSWILSVISDFTAPNGISILIGRTVSSLNFVWIVRRTICRLWIECQTNFQITKHGLDSSVNYTLFLNWLNNEMQASAGISWCRLYTHACIHWHTRRTATA